jgi:tRNA threonylcarbamoyladenosine biosynthesis protein TsaB
MKAISIDCAVSKISIASKNEKNLVKLVLDQGTRQSEKILPAIDFVLKENSLNACDLDYSAVTLGPGSFTGLRLGLSALKAMNLAHGIPVYGVNSLKSYAYQFRKSTESVLSVIESKEDEFFYAFFARGESLRAEEESSVEEILNQLDPEISVLVCGPSSKKFVERTNEITPLYSLHCFSPENDAAESLFEIAEEMMREKIEPLKDYDGPLYVRKSEAEIVLEEKSAKK